MSRTMPVILEATVPAAIETDELTRASSGGTAAARSAMGLTLGARAPRGSSDGLAHTVPRVGG
ncbi:MAG TPA: hypothetical protein DHW34_01305 [Actinobacteria bacterium]|nr:hypothetical protein [Actinomycetota bacterium]